MISAIREVRITVSMDGISRVARIWSIMPLTHAISWTSSGNWSCRLLATLPSNRSRLLAGLRLSGWKVARTFWEDALHHEM